MLLVVGFALSSAAFIYHFRFIAAARAEEKEAEEISGRRGNLRVASSSASSFIFLSSRLSTLSARLPAEPMAQRKPYIIARAVPTPAGSFSSFGYSFGWLELGAKGLESKLAG